MLISLKRQTTDKQLQIRENSNFQKFPFIYRCVKYLHVCVFRNQTKFILIYTTGEWVPLPEFV